MTYDKAEENMYACWLDTIYWLTSKAKYILLKTAGSTQAIYDMTEEQMTDLIGIKACGQVMQQKKRYNPQKIWNYIKSLGIKYTYCNAPDFPQKLIQISDPPFGIFYKGELPEAKIPAVAIIGARKCSEYGKYMAEHFATALAKRGVNIISGMALGIDGISQQAAMKTGGKSYGVLGCGVDIIYPKSNETLYKQLIIQGGILSEYPPGIEARPALFPPRNRIISALADVILVVEAREKSGTLITVDMALEQGREVYAVPGRCTDNLSKGCNKLLRQGAGVASEPEDIINDMMWEEVLNTKTEKKEILGKEKYNLSKVAKEVYEILDILPTTQNTIVMKLMEEKKSNYTVPQIYNGLVELELKGLAVRQNSQYRLSSSPINSF